MSVQVQSSSHPLGQHWLYSPAGNRSYQEFSEQLAVVASALPEHRYMLNLCEDRGQFMQAFAAAQLRGQTVLLPSSRSPGALLEIAEDYPDCYALSDELVVPKGILSVTFDALTSAAVMERRFPEDIPDKHTAALVFTSGSTGRPKAHAKTWGSLSHGVTLVCERFGFGPDTAIVATVPPQHMYGLELSLIHI